MAAVEEHNRSIGFINSPPANNVHENCDVEGNEDVSPRLFEKEAEVEQARAESIFFRAAVSEFMGGDHDKRLVFESDSESSDDDEEEEEDDIRGRDEGLRRVTWLRFLTYLGKVITMRIE